jgi:hypothetical protein
VNLRLLMAVTFHTAAHYLVAALSLAAYFAFVAGYCLAPPDSVSLLSKTDPVYQVFFQARARPWPPLPTRSRRLASGPASACMRQTCEVAHAPDTPGYGGLLAACTLGQAVTCSLKPWRGARVNMRMWRCCRRPGGLPGRQRGRGALRH